MGLTPPIYSTYEHRMSWRFRWLAFRLRARIFWHRVWIARGFPIAEWRTRYRGIKILEDRAGRAIERAAMFGK